jgi:hypothetical protein
MTKYRIVKEDDGFNTVYRIQQRFLWLFWINAFWPADISFNTLEKAIRETKHLNDKITKKVVYEE